MAANVIDADAAAYARIKGRRWRAAWVTLGVTLPIVAAILIVEYRLMIFALIVLTAPLLAVIDAVMTARAAQRVGRACSLSWGANGLQLATGLGTRVVPLARVKMIRVQPDAVIVVEAVSPTKMHAIVVPATPDRVAPLVAQLEPLGIRVQHEKQLILGVLAILAALLFQLGAGTVGAVLALAGLVKIGYWAWTRTGSPWLGLGLLAGGFGLFVLKAVLAQLLPRSGSSASA